MARAPRAERAAAILLPAGVRRGGGHSSRQRGDSLGHLTTTWRNCRAAMPSRSRN